MKNVNTFHTADSIKKKEKLVKHNDYNKKIGETGKKILDHDHGKYITYYIEL